MFEWFLSLYHDAQSWFIGVWADFVEFLSYLPVKILDSVLGAVATVFEAVPVPEFVQNNGLQTALNSISPDILYFVGMSGLDNAMAVLSAGFAFRLLRKLITLFQW